MTDDQQQSYLSQVDTLIHYDFSFCNIKEIQTQMAQTMVKGLKTVSSKCSMNAAMRTAGIQNAVKHPLLQWMVYQ